MKRYSGKAFSYNIQFLTSAYISFFLALRLCQVIIALDSELTRSRNVFNETAQLALL